MLATADEDHTQIPKSKGPEAIQALRRKLLGDLWPIEDATKVLDMDRTTIYRLEERGELAITRIKNRAYVSEESMARYIQNAKDAAAKELAKKARRKAPPRKAKQIGQSRETIE